MTGDRRGSRPRLRTILLATYLLVLAIPLGGVSLLRLYDSMLIRQTEAELNAQGAALAALVRARLEPPPAADGVDAARVAGEDFDPAIASLDLARHPVLGPTPPARPPAAPPDPRAAAVGRRLEPILIDLQRTSLAGLRLLDAAGTVVASSGSEGGQSLAHRPEVAAALAGRRSSVLRQRDRDGAPPPLGSISRGTRLRVVVAFPIAGRADAIRAERPVLGVVVLARTPMSVRQALYRDRRYFLTGAAVTAAAIVLLAWLTGATLGRPLRDLIEQTERVRRGDASAAAPLMKPVTREVEQISRAVAEMARTLIERADYIADFAANVSHEFKTPLTSIHGTVELLRDHLGEMTADEQRRFLTMLEKDAARLERLVERLLELARADVAARSGHAVTVLGPALDALLARHRALGLEVDIEGLDGELYGVELDRAELAVGPDVFDSMLGNLLENARQHGGDGVRVTVRVREIADAALRLEVADDGPGISPANRQRVFDRFFTTRRADGGSGLGLAIVRALARAHGGEVRLLPEREGTVFELELPRRR